MTKEAVNRIRELREARGWKQGELASRMNPPVVATTISRLETGERRLNDELMQRISEALGCDPRDLLSGPAGIIAGDGSPIERVTVIGEVQAGAFHALDELAWDDDRAFQIAVPSPDVYRGAKRFGLVVRGPSMNLRYLEGDILICVRVDDIDVEPPIGSRVIVYRTRQDGQIEVTCKKLAEKNGGIWLVPESSDPEFQAPVKLDDGNGSTVSIHAVVVGSYRSERPD